MAIRCPGLPILMAQIMPYWKARMTIFLKSSDRSIWEAIENGWTPPTIEVDTDGVKTIKPLESLKWTNE